MENGIAYLSGSIGKISTAKAPTTVKFDASTFNNITNKMPVRFERSPGSEWAIRVEPLKEVMPLMSLAGPPEAMTRQAHAHLLVRATEFVAASLAAPTEADHRKVMRRAKAAVSAIAQLPPGGNARIGLRELRKTLEENWPTK